MSRRTTRSGPKPDRYGFVKMRRPGPVARARGFAAHMRGRHAEVLAGLYLMLMGYRIIGFRVPTSLGEIDIVATKRKTLAIIEVKHRTDLDQALQAVSPDQRAYLRQAGRQISSTHIGLRDFWVRLDLIALAPGRWPRHIRDAWPDDAGAR